MTRAPPEPGLGMSRVLSGQVIELKQPSKVDLENSDVILLTLVRILFIAHRHWHIHRQSCGIQNSSVL